MTRIFVAPRRYIQGPNELRNFGTHVGRLGQSALIIALKQDFERVEHEILESSTREGLSVAPALFQGELTRKEATRLTREAEILGCDVIVGIGGGKACDAAKAVADTLNLPNVTVPTVASTDAPCSSLAVFYSENGTFESGDILRHNPDLVLVDSAVISRAPVRFLISGFGDALATYFEANSSCNARATNLLGALPTRASLAIAKECLDILLRDSLDAIESVKRQETSNALENVIEANTLLSGIGFESGGLAAAHSIHNGLTSFSKTHNFLHGEKVAFGVIVQLFLDQELETLQSIVDYLQSVGLPTSLADLGLRNDPETIHQLALASTEPSETIHNMGLKAVAEKTQEAIAAADSIGSTGKKRKRS